MNKDDIKITPMADNKMLNNSYNTVIVSIPKNDHVKLQNYSNKVSYKNIGNKQYKKSEFIQQIKLQSINFDSELYYKKLQSDYVRLKFLVYLTNYLKNKYLS